MYSAEDLRLKAEALEVKAAILAAKGDYSASIDCHILFRQAEKLRDKAARREANNV